ncbi:hypothetical protein [Streptomyces achromogenes]
MTGLAWIPVAVLAPGAVMAALWTCRHIHKLPTASRKENPQP